MDCATYQLWRVTGEGEGGIIIAHHQCARLTKWGHVVCFPLLPMTTLLHGQISEFPTPKYMRGPFYNDMQCFINLAEWMIVMNWVAAFMCFLCLLQYT